MFDLVYCFYDFNYGGGLWVGKCYGSGGGCYFDLMKGISYVVISN